MARFVVIQCDGCGRQLSPRPGPAASARYVDLTVASPETGTERLELVVCSPDCALVALFGWVKDHQRTLGGQLSAGALAQEPQPLPVP